MQRKGKSDSSNTIYTFDIEVVSLFQIDGTWQTFDLSMKDYSNIPMVAVPYIWMFGIDDVVYYGREFMDFTNVLKKISDQNVLKYIWIHNLGYEFQFLLNIVESENWTIEKMCSRDLRKPISFYIPEINIEFRCTYMLTNMKLEVASAIYTDVNKQTGLLNYNQMFSPLTHLSHRQAQRGLLPRPRHSRFDGVLRGSGRCDHRRLQVLCRKRYTWISCSICREKE